ncbi:SPOR domain-containing protein [Thiohalocapsa sp. ML1]|jgi:DedD protein|uniref:SPOR domain-containing protein n=1 Tax=Thiohalocapsa sp. ML1 TaxID=1431688 RepID=UPI0007323D08|nr:SPOR domain-containing protein [Thiohalocapsa sp. ML1]
MDEGAKRRLVGAAVVVALVVIFVPMLLEDSDPTDLGEPIVIPDEPAVEDTDEAEALGSLTAEDIIPPLPAPEPPPGAVIEPPQPPDADTAGEPDPAPGVDEPVATAADLAPAGPAPVPAGTMSWVVQVASLGSPDAAKGLQNRLRAKGFTAFVEQATVNGKQYYRVRVGPEVERARADNLAARLQGETGNKPLVQRYP